MTHTVDTIMVLVDRYRDLKVGEGTAQTRSALRAALTEALKNKQDLYTSQERVQISPQSVHIAQPVREPLTDDDIADIWDGWLIHITDKISAIQFARAIEADHGIGGDK